MNSSHDRDLESQQQVSLVVSNPPRKHWRRIYLSMQACHLFISVAYKAKNVSIPSISVIDTGSEGDVNIEIKEDVQVLPASRELSVIVDITCQREKINQIVKDKDLGSLSAHGGLQGIADALDTDLEKGILGDEDDLRLRRTVTTLSKAPNQSFFQLLLKTCNKPAILLLFVSAVISIGFGIEENGERTGWYEGAIIILAIITLLVGSFIRDFWHGRSKKPQEEQKTSEKKKEIDVLRGGNVQKTIISDVVPGDIVCLRRGTTVPGDGLLISGEVLGDGLLMSEKLKLDDGSTINEENPFLNYGAKVVNGCGRMLVTSVGLNTSWNQLMSPVNKPPSKTPLLAQLDKLGNCTQIIGLLTWIFVAVMVFLHYTLGRQKHDIGVPEIKGRHISIKELMDSIKRIFIPQTGKLSFLITSFSVLVVGMVEGVPFVINLAIIYWNTKALRGNASSQELLACLSMGAVTTILTDKIGGLTLDQQEVCMCWIGEESITEDSFIDDSVLEALCRGICADILMQQTCNSTEDPILSWAALKLGMGMEFLKQSCTVFDPREPKSSEGGSRVLLRKKEDKESDMCMHWKGPAKAILAMCSLYYDSNGIEKIIDEEKRSIFEKIIDNMDSEHLQITAFAYKKVDDPPFEDNSLIMIGMLGLKRIYQKEIRDAIQALRNAGVNVIMISEDNDPMLVAICVEYGLFSNSGGLVLDSEEFRNCSDEKMIEMEDKICGIGNCCSLDKLKLVQCLKKNGRQVAMVAVRTNDTAALKEANLGIAMGYWSSESVRQSSDIIICDGNFGTLVTILSYGRCTYNNLQKYIQLQLTMFIAGSLIITITTIAFGDSPFTSIHWCWANLIVAFSGGLALLTEQPSDKLMKKPPISQTESFITKAIWRNIMTQALFQTVILVTCSKSILRNNDDKVTKTMIFNSFIVCQVFNLFNAKGSQIKNMFKDIHGNKFFWVAVSVISVLQLLFTQTAHVLAGDAKLNIEQWAICFLIGTVSLAIDLAAKRTLSFTINLATSPLLKLKQAPAPTSTSNAAACSGTVNTTASSGAVSSVQKVANVEVMIPNSEDAVSALSLPAVQNNFSTSY